MTAKKKGDSTPRVSAHPSPAQPGPSADDVGKTTDTRASKKPGAKKDQATPQPVTAQELVDQPTASEVAQIQPIRRSDLPAPTEAIKVEGEPVTVIAEPHLVDPTELMPHRADTVLKDQARAQGNPQSADAPVQSLSGGDVLEGGD